MSPERSRVSHDRLIRAAWLFFAAGVSVLYALPTLYLLFHRVPLLMVGHESIAYRYFNSIRVLEREKGFVFVLQGHLLGVFQHLINVAQGEVWRIPMGDLKLRFDVLGYATLFGNAAVMSLVLFLACRSRILVAADKLLLAVVTLLPVYASLGSGIDVLVKPDYYVVQVTLVATAVWLCMREWRSHEGEPSLWRSALFGGFAGLLASNKPTLITLGMIAAWPAVVVPSDSWRRRGLRVVLGGSTAVVAFVGVIALFYLFSLVSVTRFFQRYATVVSSLGSEEEFWGAFFSTVERNPYTYIFATWLLLHLWIGWREWRRDGLRSGLLPLVGASTLMGGLQAATLVQRPASTTLFDVMLFTVASGAIILGCAPDDRFRQRVASVLLVASVTYCGFWVATRLETTLPVEVYRKNGQTVFEVWRWVTEQRRKVALLMPDNSHSAGLIEEAFMKGFSDYPTWQVTTGRKLLDQLEPGLTFHQERLRGVSPDSIVLWSDKPGEPSLRERDAGLAAAVNRPGTVCQEWETSSHKIVACRVPPMPRVALGDPSELSVVYVPALEKPWEETQLITAAGEIATLGVNDVVLTGNSGDLLRLDTDGSPIALTGREGQTIRVGNVGVWEPQANRFRGLNAAYQDGRWVVDVSGMGASNRNSRFQEGDEKEPIPGYWISPGDSRYRIERLRDGDGPFIRVRATRAGRYLAISGQDLLRTLDGVPVSVRGQIRAHSKGRLTLTLYDVVAADGRAQTYSARGKPSETWMVLTVRAERIRYPASGDNVSLGLLNVRAGDWFDVRELSLFVGLLP